MTALRPRRAHRNMQLFTPVGECREVAVVTLRLIVGAILDANTALAGALLAQVVPESPDNSAATVASCIGISLGLLDDWQGSLTVRRRYPVTGMAGVPPSMCWLSRARVGRSDRCSS